LFLLLLLRCCPLLPPLLLPLSLPLRLLFALSYSSQSSLLFTAAPLA
jgi:hypothetical protein